MRCEVFLISNFLFLISIFFVLTGCAFIPTISQPRNVLPSELKSCNSDIIASIQKRGEDLKTFKGTAQVEAIFEDGRELSGRAVIVVKRPRLFRLEIFGPFNQIIAVVTYNGESVSLLSLQEKRLYRNYPLPIDASRLPQYILGLPAAAMRNYESAEHPSKGWIESQENPPPCLYVTSKGEQILINTEGAIQEIISHASDLRGKDYNMHVSMASYKEVNSFLFPFSISISNKSFHISIKYNDMELNQQISEDLFSLSLMQGIEDIAP